MAVTLINVFSVPRDKEEEFVTWWKEVKVDVTRQPGFISGRFHKSLTPDSTYNFINVSHWASKEIYWDAYKKSIGPMKAGLQSMGIEMTPDLYDVVFEY